MSTWRRTNRLSEIYRQILIFLPINGCPGISVSVDATCPQVLHPDKSSSLTHRPRPFKVQQRRSVSTSTQVVQGLLNQLSYFLCHSDLYVASSSWLCQVSFSFIYRYTQQSPLEQSLITPKFTFVQCWASQLFQTMINAASSGLEIFQHPPQH